MAHQQSCISSVIVVCQKTNCQQHSIKKDVDFKKKIQNFFMCTAFKKKWIIFTFLTINETLSSWSLFLGPAAKQSCWLRMTPSFCDILRLLVKAYGWCRCYKVQQNSNPSLSRSTSSLLESGHQQLVANTPRIYINMHLLCSLA